MVGGSADADLLGHFAGVQRGGISRFAGLDSGRWAWSGLVYAIFGSLPDGVTSDWDFVLAHVPKSERPMVSEAYRLACDQAGSFSWSHRIVDDAGLVHSVMVVAETTIVPAADGSAGSGDRDGRCLRGYVIDLTNLRLEAARAAAGEAVMRSVAHRATIEQAKGALMLAYQLTPEAAFDLLSWHSQHGNRKLHLVATDLITAVQADAIGGNRLRATIDKILADTETAHNTNEAG